MSQRTSEGRRPLSFLRPLPGGLRPVPAVVVRPPRRAAWLRRSRVGEPRGVWAQLVTLPVPVSGAGAVRPCLRGGASMRGSFAHPLFGPLAGCGSPWPCVRGVPSPW